MKRAAIAAALALQGCSLMPITVMSDKPVAGWPKLKVIEHIVPAAQMRDACVKYTAIGSSPMACAEFNLFRRECHIWVAADFPSQHLIDHERGHCEGRPHVGDSSREQMEALVAFWRSKVTRR